MRPFPWSASDQLWPGEGSKGPKALLTGSSLNRSNQNPNQHGIKSQGSQDTAEDKQIDKHCCVQSKASHKCPCPWKHHAVTGTLVRNTLGPWSGWAIFFFFLNKLPKSKSEYLLHENLANSKSTDYKERFQGKTTLNSELPGWHLPRDLLYVVAESPSM